MAWMYLSAAGVCEILWAIGLKLYGFGLTRHSAGTVGLMLLSFWFLQIAMRTLPLGTSYAIWTGIGAVGTAVYGMVFLHESRSMPQIVCIILIICGIVGLNLLSSGPASP